MPCEDATNAREKNKDVDCAVRQRKGRIDGGSFTEDSTSTTASDSSNLCQIRFLKNEYATIKVRSREIRVFGTEFYWPMRKTWSPWNLFSLRTLRAVFSPYSVFPMIKSYLFGVDPGRKTKDRWSSFESYDRNPNIDSCILTEGGSGRDGIGNTRRNPAIDILIAHGPCKGYLDSGMGCGYFSKLSRGVAATSCDWGTHS